MELFPQHLSDVFSCLFLNDHFVDAVAQRDGTVTEFSHLSFCCYVAMSGHSRIEVQLQRRIQRTGPILRAAASRVIDQLRHGIAEGKHVTCGARSLRWE